MENTKLKYYRKLKCLSQKALGELIGADGNAVSRWERGDRDPSPYYQQQLCNFFGKDASELGFIEDSEPSDGAELDRLRRQILKDALSVTLLNPLLEGAPDSSIAIEAFLPQWAASGETFWQLYFSRGASIVEQFLPAHLTQVTTAAKETSKYQKQVASLASKAYQLQWLLTLQQQNFGQAVVATRQAFLYGELAEDPNLLLAALVREAHIYFHLKDPVRQLALQEKARRYAPDATPLLQSWLYLTLAEAHAHLDHKKEAENSFGLAYNTLPQDPKQDPSYAYVPMNRFLFANHAIMGHLHLQQPTEALRILEQFDKQDSTEPLRVEMNNRQIATFCALGDLDQTVDTFIVAEQGARKSGSGLRYNEVCSTYFDMLSRWPKEKKVHALKELLRQ